MKKSERPKEKRMLQHWKKITTTKTEKDDIFGVYLNIYIYIYIS